ncbi:MAG TPA: hypothetical protein VFT87_05450 [Candidatus Saccharimonadales bacterium]|nr:hypothetical protein [Candidatus Saccharimonadales bacterium]
MTKETLSRFIVINALNTFLVLFVQDYLRAAIRAEYRLAPQNIELLQYSQITFIASIGVGLVIALTAVATLFARSATRYLMYFLMLFIAMQVVFAGFQTTWWVMVVL